VSAPEVAAALGQFRGLIRQRVPLTSAVKINGEPLYKRAHRGETAETPEREVMVFDLRMVEFDEQAQTARLLALTGSGAYARALAEDLGTATGAGGYAAALRRTHIGSFSVEGSVTPDKLSPEHYAAGGPGVCSIDEALVFLPRHELGVRDAAWLPTGTSCGTLHRTLPRLRRGGPDGGLRGQGRRRSATGRLSKGRVTMRIYSSLDEVDESLGRGRVVAIGVFDGVHRGHQRILSQAVGSAQETGALAAAITF